LQGSFAFTHHNATVESYKLLIYSDDGALVGTGGRSLTPSSDSPLGVPGFSSQFLNETSGLYYTHFFLMPIVTIEEGQAG
ncbi:hypothetical protein PFISCL1PPCAC_25724, partial [Pristionchus fissidentatus]